MKYNKLLTNYINRTQWQKNELNVWIIYKTLYAYTKDWQLLRRLLHCLTIHTKFTQIRNCCILTGYSTGITRQIRYSRFQIRSLSQSGFLYGVRKSSW